MIRYRITFLEITRGTDSSFVIEPEVEYLMATRTDKEPSDPISILPEHIVEAVHITAQWANPYLIKKIVLVNCFFHDVTMSVRLINSFSFDERLLVMTGFKGMD